MPNEIFCPYDQWCKFQKYLFEMGFYTLVFVLYMCIDPGEGMIILMSKGTYSHSQLPQVSNQSLKQSLKNPWFSLFPIKNIGDKI